MAFAIKWKCKSDRNTKITIQNEQKKKEKKGKNERTFINDLHLFCSNAHFYTLTHRYTSERHWKKMFPGTYIVYFW